MASDEVMDEIWNGDRYDESDFDGDEELDGCLHGVGWDEECPLCDDSPDGYW